MKAPSGYSGTPLAKKLGIKPGFRIYVKNAPLPYRSLFNTFPERVSVLENPEKETVDLVHL